MYPAHRPARPWHSIRVKRAPRWTRSGLLATFVAGAAPSWPADLFFADSAPLAPGRMEIVVREVERRPRISIVQVEITKVGSSVGSSFFILCSVRQMVKARGATPHIAKIDLPGKGSRMAVGLLAKADEDPATLGAEFAAPGAKVEVLDLERFAPICDGTGRPKPPP